MKQSRTILALSLFLLPGILFSQIQVSLSTAATVQRSFKKDQRFWAFGQDISLNWHLTPTDGFYTSLSYYSNGKFTNLLVAPAKLPTTSPQQISFTNVARVSLKQISFGWRHYLVRTSDAEQNWTLYARGGFGLVFGRATNVYSTSIDTALYEAPAQPVSGIGHFKRLTLDLGLGWEWALGADIYIYAEGKTWIPTSDYPSKYLFVNNHAPMTGMISAGFRILF